MSESHVELPVPVLEHPHWRVNIRPNDYQEQLIPSLGKCLEIIEVDRFVQCNKSKTLIKLKSNYASPIYS